MINCKHYPMTFIPNFSTLKGEPQDEEENEKTYAESQEQRALERKLREEKRDLEVMKAQGASAEEIKSQRDKVHKASADIDEFCDKTGRARRKNREYTPVNAKFPDKSTWGDVSQRGTLSQNVASQATQKPQRTYSIKDATVVTEDVVANKGKSDELILKKADVYKMPDGLEIVFKHGMNGDHQKATPDFVVEQYYKVPERLREMGQKRIVVVDRYNPDDTYWRKTYKNFRHSYMTGGEDITIWRWDYKHDADYFVEALDHEIGHKIDLTMGGGGKRYSSMEEWRTAMQSDLTVSGKKSISTYGKNSESEDFAESIRYYIKDKKSFSSTMPNRGKIIDDIVNGRIAAP